MSESINFDRAAGFYDATRVVPDEIAAATTAAMLDQIQRANAGRVLEIGIGTGRIARPLARRGVRVVGVDISWEMMARLRAQLTPEHAAPALLLADATALPFADGSFRAAIVVHVFHVVSSMASCVAEIIRVLARGGVLLHVTRRPSERTRRFWDASEDEWNRLLSTRGFPRRKRAMDSAPIRRALEAAGGRVQIVDVAESRDPQSVEQELERLRLRTHSWTWPLPAPAFDEMVAEYERWRRDTVPEGSWIDESTIELEIWRWT